MTQVMNARELADELERVLERYGLVLTDDPDFDHNEETFAKAMVGFVNELRATPDREAVLEEALRNIAEGNLGDGPGQANYARIKQVAADALRARNPKPEGSE